MYEVILAVCLDERVQLKGWRQANRIIIAAKGCLQGGVIFEKDNNFKMQAYTCNVAILIGGKFEKTVSDHLQVTI